MAGKRAANEQLTSDNWDQTEEQTTPEGGFKKANTEELKKREFKTAKRSQFGSKPSSGLLSSGPFSGIKLANTSMTTPTLFSQSVPPMTTPSYLTSPPKPLPTTQSPQFLGKLRALNTSVSEWISSHVKKNPYVDLAPVFEDYQKYFAEITSEKENNSSPPLTMTSSTLGDTTKDSSDNQQDSPDSGGDDDDGKDTAMEPQDDEKPSSSKATPKDDAPEEGVLMKVRAKLFYKKDDKFVELGLGMLRVQPQEEGVRILMRNDTSIGQVLINVHLKGPVPISRQKNNILLVCPPNPPLGKKGEESADKPVTYLIKVNGALTEDLLQAISNSL